MTGDAADLLPLFGPPPPGPALDMKFRQGTVLDFDPNTLANRVNVGGTIMEDLPLLSASEARLLVPGAVVGITSVTSTQGTATWAISGRYVTPNTTDASQVASLLNSQIQSASVPGVDTATSTTYGDLGTFGPTVIANVSPSGRLLVILTAQIFWDDTDAADFGGGLLSVEMDGANIMAPTTAESSLRPTAAIGSSTTTAVTGDITVTGAHVFEGLSPGLTTVTVKYRTLISGENTEFRRRSLIVISL